MQGWQPIGQGFRDNIALILTILVVGGFLAGWLIFQTFLGAEDRREIRRMRRKLRDLETERAHAYSAPSRTRTEEALVDPVVLEPRWVRKGGAATTSEGGWLIILIDTIPRADTAVVTVRVDGLPVHTNHTLRSGRLLK